MALSSPLNLLLLLIFAALKHVIGSDPDPLQDFCVTDTDYGIFANGFLCREPGSVLPQHFKTSVLGMAGNTSGSPFGSRVTVTTPRNLPGANTQGLTFARSDIAPGGLVPPHVHPRASELVFVVEGELLIGFVDTSTKLFSQKITAGDVFVVPRALVHFLYNVGRKPVFSLSALNSQNPGASIVPLATFASEPAIPPEVLEKAFQIGHKEVEKIRKSLGG